ncbi:hypothetical protein [Serratia fonticola]|uniref:hypothetical protein n=1 Tax=Serratia fonticola TaxID=47917 RepID=UPI003AAD7610
MKLLPFTGRAVVYMDRGEAQSVLVLTDGQVMADLSLMIELVKRAGYDVRKK